MPCAPADPQARIKDSDYVFITFILTQLPHGVIGLLNRRDVSLRLFLPKAGPS